jgi:hypothetical protein
MGEIIIKSGTAPSTPSSGNGTIYVNSSDKKLYFKDENGNVFCLSSAGVGSPALNIYLNSNFI